MAKVLTASEITETARELYDWLDADTYPGLRNVCDMIMQHSGDPEMAQRYADWLSESDGRKELPGRVGDFIIALYETDISLTGSSWAMVNLGAFYYSGRSDEPDYDKAFKYYTMAAELGEVMAMEDLGYCYYYGHGAEVDYERAYFYLSQAAMAGSATALYKVGDMYRYGYYLPKQEGLAFASYRNASTADNASAGRAAGPVLLRLGDCYLNGIGTEPDAKEALNCYQGAERYLFKLVEEGNNYYRSSLKRAVEGQEAARKILRETLG